MLARLLNRCRHCRSKLVDIAYQGVNGETYVYRRCHRCDEPHRFFLPEEHNV